MHKYHYLLTTTAVVVFLATSLMAQQDTLLTWCQSTWHRGFGQQAWSDSARFWRQDRVAYGSEGEISVVAWEKITVAEVSQIYCMAQNDSLIFCGTTRPALYSPNVFKSPDGAHWDRAIDYPVIDPVSFDSVSINSVLDILAAADGGLYAGGQVDGSTCPLVLKSTDGSHTWQTVGSLPDSVGQSITSFARAADGTLYAGTGTGSQAHVYRSTDGGNVWTDTDTLHAAKNAEALLLLGDTLYAATHCQGLIGRVFKTADGGATWDTTGTIPDAAWVFDIEAIGSTIYVAVTYRPAGSYQAAVFYTTDGGDTWTHYQDLSGSSAATTLLADGDTALYVGTASGAKVWIAIPPDSFISMGTIEETPVNDLLVTQDGILLVAAGTSIYRAVGASLPGWLESSVYDTRSGTTYGTISWNSQGEAIYLKARSGNDPDMITATPWAVCDTVANGQDISDLTSVQDGHRYLQYYAEIARLGPAFPSLYSVCMDYTAPYDTISPLFDSTTIWSDSNAWFGGPYEVSTVITDDFAGVDGDNIYLHWTNDDWQTETVIQMDEGAAGHFTGEIRRQVEGDTVEYYLFGQDLSFQTNEAYDPSQSSSYQFVVVPEGPRFFNTTQLDTVYHTGPYFIGTLVKDASLDPYAVVLRYRIDGGAWIDTTMSVYPNDLFIGKIPGVQTSSTIDYYVWAIDTLGQEGTDPASAPDTVYTFPALIGIAEERIPVDLSLTYALSQNRPNPFSSTSAIAYEVPVETQVSVKVYDGLGRVIDVLADGWRTPGRYLVTWNRCDSRGHRVPAGAYFYRIEAEGFSATRKMVVIE